VTATTTPVDAATVLLVRDGPDGLEVFLLERHLRSDFFGGAYVFPGGKVDEPDAQVDRGCWDGVDPAVVGRRIGADPSLALGLLVAAVRETFEEAGVLLASVRSGGALRPVTTADLDSGSFVDARRRLAARGEHWDWRPWLADEGIVLDLGALHPWSWWITPEGQHRRFDTRFFVAALPEAQRDVAAHDDVEATASVWATPAAALAARERGEYQVIFPTRRNLLALQAKGSVGGVLTGAAGGTEPLQPILPVASLAADGTVMVTAPGLGDPEPVE